MKLLIILCLLLPIVINANCENGIKDSNEADVDCGKECFELCKVDKNCNSDFDCESWKCMDNRCVEDEQTLRFLVAASGPVAEPKKVVKQTLEFTGLTKAVADTKKTEIEGDIAKSLGVNAKDVTIISITEVDARRRRNLLAKKLVIVYEVKVKDEAAATALKTKMKSTAFADNVKAKVEASTGATVTVAAGEPVISDAPSRKVVVSMSIATNPSALTFVIAFLFSIVM